MSQNQDRYLDNPEVQKALRDMNEAVAIWQSGFMTSNYNKMCHAAGMMYSVASMLYRLNDQIGTSIAVDTLREATPAISEELAAAFPGVDASELAYEGERPPRIEDALSSNQAHHTPPATAANSKKASPQASFEAGQGYRAPS